VRRSSPIFFFLLRRSPSSPLFPYTTLFRSEGPSGGLEGVKKIFEKCRRCRVEQEGDPVDARCNLLEQLQPLAGSPSCSTRQRRRSEEHTSELQSLTNLVCRLLLEKKKANPS